MYKDLDEQIDVIVLYQKGTLKPLRFLWNGRSFRIARVTGTWKATEGDRWMRHFAIVDASNKVLALRLSDDRATQLRLSKMWPGSEPRRGRLRGRRGLRVVEDTATVF